MNSWQEGTIHDLSCHIARPNTKREGRLHLAKGIETDHLAKLNADNKHVTASHTLSNCQDQASQTHSSIKRQISTRSRKPHPQHVTTLTMNKRNEKARRQASRRSNTQHWKPKERASTYITHTQKQLTPKVSNKHVNLSWDGTCSTIGHPNSPQH